MINKFLFLIRSTQLEKTFAFVLLSSIFILLAEAISLGSIVPVIYLIVDINSLDNQIFNSIFDRLSIFEINLKILSLAIFTLLIFLLKLYGMLLVTKYQESKVNFFLKKLEGLIFSKFINQQYLSFVEGKNSDFTKIFQVELSYFYFFLKAFLVLISESFFLFLVIVLIFYFEPIISLIGIALFGTLFILKYNLSKNAINVSGKRRQEYDREISNILDESIRGFKEMKLEFKVKDYENRLNEVIESKREQIIFEVVKNVSPKYYFELIAILSLLFFVVFFTIFQKDPNIILKLGIFIPIVFKSVPSLNRILISLQSIKFRKQSINVIYSFLKKNKKTEDNNTIDFETEEFKSILISKLKINFKGKIIFENLNLEVFKNQKIGILGPSGSGKSTLVNYITGLIDAKNAKIFYNNRILENIIQIRKKIGYVPQKVFISNESLAFNIKYGVSFDVPTDHKKLIKIINVCQLNNLFNENEIYNKRLGDSGSKLSGGQIQRIGIARALYKDSEIIILDESTSALDKASEKNILDLLYSLNKTIIFISHDINVLERCDDIYELKDKELKKI